MSGAPLTAEQAAIARHEMTRQAQFLANIHKGGKYAKPDVETAHARWCTLTPCEVRVAILVGRGMPVKIAAGALHIAPSTCSDHLRFVRGKLRVHNAAQLSCVLGQIGLL